MPSYVHHGQLQLTQDWSNELNNLTQANHQSIRMSLVQVQFAQKDHAPQVHCDRGSNS